MPQTQEPAHTSLSHTDLARVAHYKGTGAVVRSTWGASSAWTTTAVEPRDAQRTHSVRVIHPDAWVSYIDGRSFAYLDRVIIRAPHGRSRRLKQRQRNRLVKRQRLPGCPLAPIGVDA